MKPGKKPSTKNPGKASVPKSPSILFDKIDEWIDRKKTVLLYIIFSSCIVFSFLLFSTRISEAHDDSLYMEAGYNYAKNFTTYYYTANAPFYPMFLALPISLFGLNLILLKLLSVAFNFFHLYFLYKAFEKRIPNLILFSVLFITAINFMFLYFATYTYSEAFFLFFQSLFFYLFFRLTDALDSADNELKKTYKKWLYVGCIAFIMSLTKNVAIIVVPAIGFFFLVNKNYRYALYSIVSFLCFKIPFEIIKKLIWNQTNQYAQGAILLQKDPYNASAGKEDLAGFIGRIYDNSLLYLSKRFFQILGFLSEESVAVSLGLTVLVIVLLLFGFYRSVKSSNKPLIFSTIYFSSMTLASFIILQARWDQPRIIMIYISLILFVVFYGFYDLLHKKFIFFQRFFLLIVIATMASVLISSTRRAKINAPILSKSIKGDIYCGYTLDWVNFLKMSEWCGENLPDSALVVSRKAPMSFVYAKGKKFFPLYQVISVDTTTKMSNPDSVLAVFKRSKVTHVIVASLRSNPEKADGNIINTVHRVLYPVMNKYPDKVKLVYQIPEKGQPQIEPAYLYQITY